MLDLNLKGKVAAVTGASEGVGKAVALKLAEEGCHVAICARRRDVLDVAANEIREATGARVQARPSDVTKSEEVEAFISAAVEEFGGLDILVNNAGRSAAFHFDEATEEIWQEDFALKLWAAVRSCRVAIPEMKKRGGGCIVNITHPGGKSPGSESVPTSVTRAAGIAFTKALSKDVAQDNIRVNTVCLTNIATAQWKRRWKREGSKLSFEAWCEAEGKEIPLGRLGEPREVADLVAFLVSERADFITGTAINIDGGKAAAV